MPKVKRRKSRRKLPPVSLKPAPMNGDHGPMTYAARAGKVLRPIEDENGKNPNSMARMEVVNQLDGLGLTMRQRQAADLIRNAFCKVEMLSSGAPLKEQVDSSPKPDAAVAAQVDAMSHLVRIMKPVGRGGKRRIVEWICWHNRPGRTCGEVRWQARLCAALDDVADAVGY